MPRAKRLRSSALPAVIAGHAIAQRDPQGAVVLGSVLRSSVVVSTRSSYDTAEGHYLGFCARRGLTPWPVDTIWFCSWMLFMARSVLPSSLKMYMSGVRHHQILEGFDWSK